MMALLISDSSIDSVVEIRWNEQQILTGAEESEHNTAFRVLWWWLMRRGRCNDRVVADAI